MPTPVVSNVFGRIVTAAQIEKAAIETIKEWMPDYLEEMEKQHGWKHGTLPVPLNYTNRNSFDMVAGEPIPKVVVISPGMEGAPHMNGSNQYRALWQLGVGVAIAARTEELANDHVKAYGGAVRKILLDKQSLGGFEGVAQIVLTGEVYDDIDLPNPHQLYKSAGVYFLVDVENIVTARHGPKYHHQPSYGQVQEIDIDLVKVPIDEDI